jgi:formylglycine-generating enzyme required for sulfatase activity
MRIFRFNCWVGLIGLAVITSNGFAQETPKAITNSLGMKLTRIPAGTFNMGSPRSETGRTRKEVTHDVTLTKSFHLGIYEVTQAEYVTVMTGTPNFRNRAAFKNDRGGSPQHPMENVEWEKAVEFCKRLSNRPAENRAGRKYRLPSEAEWEYACRAGSKTPFHIGESLAPNQANFNGNYPYGNTKPGVYRRKTAKVGSYKPNAFGLHDMHGNVAEWCSDYYDPEYYEDSPEKNPLGPPVGVVETTYGDFFRVVRGGCWVDDARACRSAYRYRAMPATQYRLIGFRVVCIVAESTK